MKQRKSDRINIIYEMLDSLCPAEIRFLPHFDEDWKFLFCVIMSAQTTDRQVASVAEGLFATFPALNDFASADVGKIEELIKSTGFYHNKAANLKAAAAVLLDKFDGRLPDTIDKLVTLPGVGRKTANCVIGECFGKGAIIVDTHFGRLMNRLGLCKSKDPAVIEDEVRKLLSGDKQYRFSMCGNFFARTRCTSRSPKCDGCPLAGFCPEATILSGSVLTCQF